MSFHRAFWLRLRPWIHGAAATVQKRPAASLVFALLGIALALCYGSTFAALAAEWSRSDTYSYGYLVPWISLYLAWTQRDKLRATRLAPNWPAGAALVGIGIAAKVIGFAGGATVIEGLSLIPVLAGGLLLFGGVGLLRALLLPLLYLLFMIPIWEVFTGRLSPHFQFISAWLGIGILNVVGVPAVRDGFYIHLPGMTLHVAEACSGINYLIAVTAIGIPLAWTTFTGMRRRLALIGFGVAVAIVFNALRVAVIGILLYLGVSHDTHGPGHVLQGLSVTTMGYVALFLGAWALSRYRPEKRVSVSETHRATGADHGLLVSPVRAAVALSIAFLAVFTWEASFRPTPMPLSRPLSDLPLEIGSWRGGEGSPGAIPLVAIPGSDRLERVYSSPSGFTASVVVIYVPDQSGDRELVGYRTTPLLQGGTAVAVRPGTTGPAEVRRSETREHGYSTVTFAWYDIGGHVTPSPLNAKLRTTWHVLSRGTSNGALVAVRAEYSSQEAAGREPELRAFVEQMLDSLRSALRSRRSVSA